MGPDSHVFEITRLIQLAVAPVFLLTAVGTIINAIINRLSRAVDRRRQLEELLPAMEGDTRTEMLDELHSVARRIRLSMWSIATAVMSALFVCLLIGIAFVSAFIRFDLSKAVAGLFIAAMVALTVSLLLLLREVFIAALRVRYPPQLQDAREARK